MSNASTTSTNAIFLAIVYSLLLSVSAYKELLLMRSLQTIELLGTRSHLMGGFYVCIGHDLLRSTPIAISVQQAEPETKIPKIPGDGNMGDLSCQKKTPQVPLGPVTLLARICS